MSETPHDKKSETLQIRIPHEMKQNFVEACREDRVSASDRLRGWIEKFLSERERPSAEAPPEPAKGLIAMIPKPVRKRRYLVAGAAVLTGAAFLVLPSAAQSFRTMFDQLDANHDGKVTELEFMAKSKSILPMIVRDSALNDVRAEIAKPYDPSTMRLDAALHEALRSGKRTVESITEHDMLSMLMKPVKMPADELERLRQSVRETLNDPPRKEYLPPRDPELLAKVRSGARTIESLSAEELHRLIPHWNDKDFPVIGIGSRGEKFDPCSYRFGISDAEFANPWMNSNSRDMRKMYLDGDRDGSGAITFEEFQISQTQTARLWFSSMDRNGDGVLSASDAEISKGDFERFRAANPDKNVCPPDPEATPRWVPLDANHDGRVNFEEYLVAAEKLDPR